MHHAVCCFCSFPVPWKGPHHIHSLRSHCFTKKSAFNVTGNLVIVVKFTFQIVFGNSRQIQDTLAREVTMSHSRCILSFDLIDKHQNKRFYVMETVLLLAFSDVIFGGRETMTGNTSAAHRLANR